MYATVQVLTSGNERENSIITKVGRRLSFNDKSVHNILIAIKGESYSWLDSMKKIFTTIHFVDTQFTDPFDIIADNLSLLKEYTKIIYVNKGVIPKSKITNVFHKKAPHIMLYDELADGDRLDTNKVLTHMFGDCKREDIMRVNCRIKKHISLLILLFDPRDVNLTEYMVHARGRGDDKLLALRYMLSKNGDISYHRGNEFDLIYMDNNMVINSVISLNRDVDIINGTKFPYYRDNVTLDEIKDDLNKLKHHMSPIIYDKKYGGTKYNGRYTAVVEDYAKYYAMLRITDYFSEECRLRCRRTRRGKLHESPIEYFDKNTDKIIRYCDKNFGVINMYTINEAMYAFSRICTSFNTTLCVTLMKLFNAKKIIDTSAGWGDRLVSAIAIGAEYTGIDPSNCMNKLYHDIVNKLVDQTERNKYKIIHDGAENVDMGENIYDFSIISPPYFDLEVYEDDDKQSINVFSTPDSWRDGFLIPITRKLSRALRPGGRLAFYISDFDDLKYTNNVHSAIIDSGLNFEGMINWTHVQDKGNHRDMRIYKK